MRAMGWVAGFVFAWLGFCAPAVAADAPAVGSGVGSCVALNATALEALRLAQAESKPSRVAALVSRRPMTDRELRVLITVLSSVQWDTTAPTARSNRSSNERLPLQMERLGVLLLDSSAILARTQLEEMLKQIRSGPNPDLTQLKWGEAVLGGLDGCLRDRYAAFGGDPAFRQVSQLVLANRTTLERLISEPHIASRTPPEPQNP